MPMPFKSRSLSHTCQTFSVVSCSSVCSLMKFAELRFLQDAVVSWRYSGEYVSLNCGEERKMILMLQLMHPGHFKNDFGDG